MVSVTFVKNNLKKFYGSFVFESIYDPAGVLSAVNCILEDIFLDSVQLSHSDLSDYAFSAVSLLFSLSLSIILIFRLRTILTTSLSFIYRTTACVFCTVKLCVCIYVISSFNNGKSNSSSLELISLSYSYVYSIQKI